MVGEKYESTDSDMVNIVVYCHWSNAYLKDIEMALKLTEYEKFNAKLVYLLSYIDNFFKRCIILDETTPGNWFKLCREWT